MDKNLSIKKLRLWNELTQKEMGDLMGLAESTYAQKEQGVTNWTLSDIVTVKKLFKINIDDLEEIKKL